MKWHSRAPLGQEMIEALFSVLAASIILASAMVVFSSVGEEGKDPAEEAYRILERALNWEIWLEGDAIDVYVARGVDEDLLSRTLGAGRPFLLRFYTVNGSVAELILERGERPVGEVSVLSSPTVFIVGPSRAPGILEVVA
ncbi:MAG: hypothetical protein DRN42_01695 [Thermoplasmata archaeon]|nr:MAG: hypothetical protein DRN55_01725 [Thermoplasmata archaeon]RLF76092.1 MAG: hypothetical protein DRN42_01695 [Thermoplasmata archaeon]HDD59709.1 hypothetical protein [Euryarchaeota archaeon]